MRNRMSFLFNSYIFSSLILILVEKVSTFSAFFFFARADCLIIRLSSQLANVNQAIVAIIWLNGAISSALM